MNRDSKGIPMKEAAERLDVNRKTLKRWIRGMGYAAPRAGIRYVPEWMIEKYVEQRSPQIPRASR